ncbi:hypothetical protein MKZ38_003854 [Zalerion maritima]|uniref:Uncharacterized protein n=1 Tax=Zalerion maritima TaxID=339359 RepID=A0AAD5WPY9_9PEZI|nr:hypothetical protein MKZ38_003854 [Zalerion maritima]
MGIIKSLKRLSHKLSSDRHSQHSQTSNQDEHAAPSLSVLADDNGDGKAVEDQHDPLVIAEGEAQGLPTPISDFIPHLSSYPQTTTRGLLRPYLAYETCLRKAFAKGDHGVGIDDHANLVPIYDGHEKEVRIRTTDRDTRTDEEKYLMPVPDEKREEDGQIVITESLSEYEERWEGFTHAALTGMDWMNVVAAGSSALLPLLSHRKDVNIRTDPAVEKPIETYFQKIAASSDIDLFLYGLDSEEAAIERITRLEATVRKNQRLSAGGGLVMRSENAITFISPKWPFRHVQIILRLYKSISEILTGFDVDCACVAYDGRQVYSNPRGVAAIITRTNTVDLSRRSPSYENRLYKYRFQNFDAYWEGLDRSRIPEDSFHASMDPKGLTGLGRLLFFEKLLEKRRDAYRRKRLLKRIEDSSWKVGLAGGKGDKVAQSGYAAHEIPYGERFNAASVRKYVVKHSQEPYRFGTLQEVVSSRQRNDENRYLGGKLTFIKDDPGRQMIGSFHPLTEDDWTDCAYQDV